MRETNACFVQLKLGSFPSSLLFELNKPCVISSLRLFKFNKTMKPMKWNVGRSERSERTRGSLFRSFFTFILSSLFIITFHSIKLTGFVTCLPFHFVLSFYLFTNKRSACVKKVKEKNERHARFIHFISLSFLFLLLLSHGSCFLLFSSFVHSL